MKLLKITFAILMALVFVQCEKQPEPLPPAKIEIGLEKTYYSLERFTGKLTIPVSTKADIKEWKIDQGTCRWVQINRTSTGEGTVDVVITYSANTAADAREAVLRFVSADGSEELATVTLNQDGVYTPVVDVDDKVKPTGARCDDYQPGGEIALSYDGDRNTMYHSRWNGTVMPVVIEYYFDGKNVIDYLMYYPRLSGGSNGNFGRVSVSVATDAGRTYEAVGDFDFEEKGSPSMVQIPGKKKPTAIRIEVKSGSGNFASCSEMEFYTSKSGGAVEQSLLTVFKDLTLTELKPGVTDAEIQALQPFFRKTALMLKNNTYEAYDKEFRIREYKPYSNPSEWKKKLMTMRYSDLDNPTGISVQAGEEIVVCVGDTHGYNVAIQCIWEHMQGSDPGYLQTSTSGPTYLLKPGINKITMDQPGQLFVMYTAVPSDPNAKPIKIHILPGAGTVQGFFDLAEHKTDAKYDEIRRRCTHKYLAVRGERFMFYFHRAKMTSKIVDAIKLFDNIIAWQHELMGLEGIFPEQFNNHILGISPEGSFMWASDNCVGFTWTVLTNILDVNIATSSLGAIWGQAHEIGHVNQKAINWASCGESSNNLFSNYIVRRLGMKTSRGRELESVAICRYLDKQSWYNMGDATHMNEDTETHMRMFWQLWIYFHLCEKDTKFYPKFFTLMRELGLNDTQDCGRKQIEFAKRASKAAGLNLTDFFEQWGFLEPVNAVIEQYGTYNYLVTSAMVQEAKEYMAQFPKPKHAIEYIEDRKYNEYGPSDALYKTLGDCGHYTTYLADAKLADNISATVKDRNITINNGREAVAFEIRRGMTMNDDIVYFFNHLIFTVPDAVDLGGCHLFAVQANGERKHLCAL